MKNSIQNIVALALLSFFALCSQVRAEITSEMQDSVVRIFAYDAVAAPDSLAFPVVPLKLSTGDVVDYVPD